MNIRFKVVNTKYGGSTLQFVNQHSISKVAAALVAASLWGFAGTAQADLAAIGPVNPATEFPTFVIDGNNTQIAPCDRIEAVLEGTEVLNNAPCAGTELEDPGVPGGDPGPGFVAGNILEFTYYRTEANIVDGTPQGERFRLRIEVQGGVIPPASINNAVRLRLRNLVNQGTYLVRHPFNTDNTLLEVEVGPDEIESGVDMELDGGQLGQAPDFSAALSGPVMCFWSNGSQTTVDGQDFLGDGVAEAPLVPISGNPNCSQDADDLVFRVTIPAGNGQPITTVEIADFSVEAKLFDGVGILPLRSTYERNANGNVARIDLWVKSVAGATIPVTGDGIPNGRDMVEDASRPGTYFLRQRALPAGSPAPDTLNVAGATVSVADEINITRARHNVNTDLLEIRVASSDVFGAPTLTACCDGDGNPLGVLVGGQLNISGGLANVPPNAPPFEITVTSSQGGSASKIVDVRGGNIFE